MSETNIASIVEKLLGPVNSKWGFSELTAKSKGQVIVFDAELANAKTVVDLELDYDSTFYLTRADNDVNVVLQIRNIGTERAKVTVDPTYPCEGSGPRTTVLHFELNPGAGTSLTFSDGSGVKVDILPNRP